MSSAIVPVKVAQILPLEVFTIERGGRNTVVLASGKIASDIELIAYDERARTAKYELRVANGSDTVLACYAYAVRGSAGERPVTCASVAVMPFSGVAVTFELPLPFIGNYERITVEMHGDGVDLSSDTIPPGRDYRVLVRRAIAVASVTIASCCAAIAGFVQPHIVAVAVPSAAIGGMPIKVAYESHGFGKMKYGLIAPDGTIIGEGTTAAANGSITFNMPANTTSRSYMVSLEKQNFFGGDARMAVIKDLAPPPPRMTTRILYPAAITSLALEHSRITAGTPIVVHYTYTAQSGLLRLIDSKDAIWAATPVDARGIATFMAPHVDQAQDMRIALHVEKGNTSADSEVGVTLTPAVPPPLRFKAINGAPLEIEAKEIIAGEPFSLRVIKNVADLHISLQDPHGTEVEGFNVDGMQTVLHAPVAAAGQNYTLIITFTDRNGQETVVTPVPIKDKHSAPKV